MTTNEHWIYLEMLRRSGVTNMYGAAPYLVEAFGVSKKDAVSILVDWMEKYNRADYEGL